MAIEYTRLKVQDRLIYRDDGEKITPEHVIPCWRADEIAKANGMQYAENVTKAFDGLGIVIDSQFKIVEVLGEVNGIKLNKHEGMPLQAELITGDDGDWFISNVSFDTAWLDDLIKVAQATKEAIKSYKPEEDN